MNIKGLVTFLKFSTIAISLRFVSNLIVINFLYSSSNNAYHIAQFNSFLNIFTICTSLSTMAIGTIIVNRNKILLNFKEWDNEYLTLFTFGLFSTLLTIIIIIILYFINVISNFYESLAIGLLLMPNYIAHIYLNNNNALLKYRINNNITIVTFLLIILFAVIFIKLMKEVELFKYIYISLIVLVPLINICLFDDINKKKIKNIFITNINKIRFNILFHNNTYIVTFFKEVIYILIISLNPFIFYFMIKWIMNQYLYFADVMDFFEILYRYYSLILSFAAILFTSYLIPSLNRTDRKRGVNVSSSHLIVLIVLYFVCFICYYLYVTSHLYILQQFYTYIFLFIVLIKIFQFVFFQIKYFKKKFQSIIYLFAYELFIYSLIIISAILYKL